MFGITSIVLTAESLNEPLDYEDLSTDVIVDLDNGDRYIATFFTYKSLTSMIESDVQSGDSYTEHYYRILNMVLIKDFNKGDLRAIIERMISEGDFQVIFTRI